MKPISYQRHRFPPTIIRYAAWLYLRFTLSLRDMEDLLAQRGIEVSYEAIRTWTGKFGGAVRPKSSALALEADWALLEWTAPLRHRCAKLRSFQISGEETARESD